MGSRNAALLGVVLFLSGCNSPRKGAATSLAGIGKSALSQLVGGETEPNDAAATATPIGNNAVVRANIMPVGDNDYFQFTGNAGDRVYAATMTQASVSATASSDTWLYLL